MSRYSTRGLGHAVHTVIANQPNRIWDAETVLQKLNGKHEAATRQAVVSSLCYLVKQGHAERVSPGIYKAVPVTADAAVDPEAVIDQLLGAMAAAEPVLRKAKAVMGALKAVNND